MAGSNDLRKSKVVIGNVYGAIDDLTGALSKGYGLFSRATLEFPVKSYAPNGRSLGSVMRSRVMDPRDPDRVESKLNRIRSHDFGIKEEIDLSEVRISRGISLIKDDEEGPVVTFNRAARTTVPGIHEDAQFNAWHEAVELYGKRALRYGPRAYQSILAPSSVSLEGEELDAASSESVIDDVRAGESLRNSEALTSPINGKEYVTIHSLHPNRRDLRIFQLPGRLFARKV